MMGGKAGSKIKNTSNGVRVDSSVYGSCIPVIIGRTRVSGKMIFAGNYKTHKSSQKKGGGKKGQKQASFSGNFDWLLGYAPIVAIGDVFRNKDNFWPVGISSQSFGDAAPNPFTITNNPGKVLGIISVLGSVLVNETFNDYGAPGSVTVNETQQLPLYPAGQLSGGVAANIAPGGLDWRVWNTFPTYKVNNFNSNTAEIGTLGIGFSDAFPITVFYFYQLASKSPMASAGLEFEAILGSGSEFSYSGGSQFQIQYPEFAGYAGSNLDLGTGNTAPNDNIEVISLYAYSQNGDANPADAILDVILAGLPTKINDATSGFNWQHGLGFTIGLVPDGTPSKPNCLADPPVPVV